MRTESQATEGPPLNSCKYRVSQFVDTKLGPEFQAILDTIPMRHNEYGYDPFGFHRDSLKYAAFFGRLLYRKYFRCQIHGSRNLPSGRLLLVANHSGQLPFDGLSIAAALLFDFHPPRIVRSMVEKFVPTLPFVSYLFPRWGQITGTPENCARLLQNDEVILVFPEGVRGISKSFTKRYQLQEFGLGFVRLALETNTPIVPIAVVGAEEQAPAVNLTSLARLLHLPALPLMPLPPFFPALPLPVKYHLWFGEPLYFTGDSDDDDDVIAEQVATVKNTIQSMIHIGLKERHHVFW